MIRSFAADEFPVERMIEAKRGRRVSVCLPARDEADTVAGVVGAIWSELMEGSPLVDELIVIDDSSVDATAALAGAAGARVIPAGAVLPEYGIEAGKGQALWRAVHAASGDLVVFCDSDIRGFDPRFILGLVGPLLTRDDVQFVKGCYDRPLDGRPGEGGRVTELMARPLISSFFPHLAPLLQPLSGECAAWRSVLETVPFVGGYGVDLGLLIDVSAQYGASALVQCHLGERVHRNRSLAELSVQALAILQLGLSRAGVAEPGPGAGLLRPGSAPVPVSLVERPPLCQVPAHRKSA
ncbi:MAG: glucosyl-3-phosphoglycerate synthase [Acidimicrobiales bacterium]